ncbi:MAG: hypothetical protein H7A37_00465 [Chlamydiales bacterium]|nr:hypothetical protein [Chlamydiia bacterium]MCP5506766.1 hypothetical protein [Chlamydiales bacterium]
MQPDDELKEKDFIHEEYPKDPGLFWVWTAVFFAVVAVFWGVGSWYTKQIDEKVESSPFLQVTNRELSLFLWQFPQHMRQHVKAKTGYLPGFEYVDKIGIAEGLADVYAVAPPKVLFLYHTWDRLLRSQVPMRVVPPKEFMDFLEQNPEWLPDQWPAAPEGYAALVKGLKDSSYIDLSKLPASTFPKEVHLAFQGWKNYFKEGDKINLVMPTYGEMEKFIRRYSHYARNYWQNILNETYPKYLMSFTAGGNDPKAVMPSDEIAPFLKVSLYNEKMQAAGK